MIKMSALSARADFCFIAVRYSRLVAVGRWMRHECYGGDGKQPERLNAEGFSPSAFSRGLSVSATPGTVAAPGKASEGRESCRQ